ncbi:MAG: nucleoside triphosphate pyrophosphohydrolase [Rhodobiaceae bacterium]|jgi:MazG family protein|nr:nucleoside triphosphate pyrophosphohydrolase [Rhodobiaceae bacterium]MBT7280216.1 nucleoside triphosphate pyrophosphohydrolase [Rhodobiaceae bacterium]
MAALRDPDTGCPWDIKQDFKSIAPYTLEEAYEVVDAIETGDMTQLRDELGDLLLQVVFHARMAEEAEHFTFDDVVHAIADKMERRHPHVFGDLAGIDSNQVKQNWEDIKAQERAEKSDDKEAPESLLDDVPRALPALTRAVKLQKRAARIGFDWTEAEPIFDKLEEETAELQEAIALQDRDAIEDELGDVMFVVANLARHLKLDPEKALRRGNAKFTRRFQNLEQQARAQSTDMSDFLLEDLEIFWQRAKAGEPKDD